MWRRVAMVCCGAVWLLSQAVVGEALGADDQVDYLSQIKPLLTERCYACHSALKQESELRVDTAALLVKGGESGEAISPGDADESLLIEMVTADEGSRMPPEGKPLTDAQIALLKTWINQGATAPDDEQPSLDPRTFWSFLKVVRPAVPQVNDTAADNPIDAFIAVQLQQRKLTPRPRAERNILLRRIYLDLIGLPPTLDQLRAFLDDDTPEAYERVVDQLLESPHYGERWGRHWMDVWRYSDWYGSRAINEIRYSQRHIWRWRDWIIDSLNGDKGYDQMILEMLAGDEIAADDPSVLPATGFLGRNWYKFNRSVWLQQTVEHTSMGLLGVTMKCARCHDHKFDPLEQKEYYQFRAFFEPHDVRTDMASGEVDIAKDGLSRVYDKQLDVATYLFRRGDDRDPVTERPLSPATPAALGGEPLEIHQVSLPVEGYYPALAPGARSTLIAAAQAKINSAEEALSQGQAKLAGIQEKLDELLASSDNSETGSTTTSFLTDDFSKPRSDLWQTLSGTWTHKDGGLTQSQVTSFATIVTQQNHPQDFKARVRYKTLAPGMNRSVGLSFDYQDQGNSQDVYTSANDTRPSVQAFHRQGGKQMYPRAGIVPCPIEVGELVDLEIEVRGQQLRIFVGGELKLDYVMPLPRKSGKFALWVHNGAAEFLDLEITALKENRDALTAAHRQALAAATLLEKRLAESRVKLQSLKARIAAEMARYAQPANPQADSLALAAGRAEKMVAVTQAEIALLAAQQYLAETRIVNAAKGEGGSQTIAEAEKKTATAQKALAKAQAAAEKETSNYQALGTIYPKTSTGRRSALARWIASRENPRTARIAVNHIWLRHFGQAIVPSVADFGLRAKPRSHPLLLDYLAAELMDNGWKMKPLHRLIVTSEAYQRKSSIGDSQDNVAIDPQNVYLWRMNSRRMEAEIVRDSVLSVAGALDTTMGGAELDEKTGLSSRRRSVYFRVTPDNSMEFLDLFDLASPNMCYQRRDSVVPQQALALINSTLAQSNARLVAKKISERLSHENAEVTETAFISAAFETTLCRPPTEKEFSECEMFLREQTALLTDKSNLIASPAGAAVKVKPSDNPATRARENLLHVLLNHNDFVTIR